MISFRSIFLKSRWTSCVHSNLGLRSLYSSSSLGLDDYIITKRNFQKKSPVDFNKFREKMKEQVSKSDHTLVFTEELKQMIHIAEPTTDDLELIEKMIIKFHGQTNVRFGLFTFGPVVMRMYHCLNKPTEALKVYYHESLDGFFDQLISHLVLMDLLFNNEMYDDVIKVYKRTREKQLTFGKFPKSITVLVYAALYKINTAESYNYMIELWKEMELIGHEPIRRVISLAAMLALNQNYPEVALEILSKMSNHNFHHVRSIKTLCHCALGQTEDALIILASVLAVDVPVKTDKTVHTFPKDVIEVVKEHVKMQNRKDLTMEFNRIEKQMNKFDHICEKTLDETLCEEATIINPVGHRKNLIRVSFHNIPNIGKRYPGRPGLEDMI